MDEDLNELDLGAWSGRRFDELQGDDAWAHWNRLRQHSRPPPGTAPCASWIVIHLAMSLALTASSPAGADAGAGPGHALLGPIESAGRARPLRGRHADIDPEHRTVGREAGGCVHPAPPYLGWP